MAKIKDSLRSTMTTKELAERWGMEYRTLENWRQKKIGPRFIKLENGLVRYMISDILTYEQSKKVLR